MQEAFGGTFLLKIFMIFFIIYVAFIGIALNFAKIYRIKNNVINILEQYQYDMDNRDNGNVYNNLEEYLNNVPYGFQDAQGANFNNYCKRRASDGEKIDRTMYTRYGVCTIQKGDVGKYYYSVTVYYVIDFPILDLLKIPITASGETIVIKS